MSKVWFIPGSSKGFGRQFTKAALDRADYDGLRVRQVDFSGAMKLGERTGVGPALLALADLPEPPLRVLFGQAVYDIVEQIYEERLKTWVEHRDITLAAQGN
jgi:hypothetical protein